MELNSIEHFYAVAKVGSLSKVAAELGIEQSTLTRQINRLEEFVGVKLFHRTGRGMALNEKGRVFLQYAEEVMGAATRARAAAAELAWQGPAQIIIAAQPTIAQVTFGPVGHALRKEYPGTTIRFVEGLGHQIMDCLQEGAVDIALLYLPNDAKQLVHERLVQEPLYCISPPGPEKLCDSISALDFIALPLVLPSTAHGLRALAQSIADRYNKRLDISVECDGSTFLTRRLVQMLHGHTFLPFAAVANEVAAGLLRATRIDDAEMIRSVVMTTATGKPPIAGLVRVTRLVKDTIAELVANRQWPGVQKMG